MPLNYTYSSMRSLLAVISIDLNKKLPGNQTFDLRDIVGQKMVITDAAENAKLIDMNLHQTK